MRITAGEIGTRGAEVRHEQRVADKGGIIDLVGDVGRSMARRARHDLAHQFADLEAFAVGEQLIEVAAVSLQVVGGEHRPENLLHVLDVLADTDLGAGLGLDVGRARQVVGVGVRLERPHDGPALLPGSAQNRLDRPGVDRATVVVVVEDGSIAAALLGCRIDD